MAATNNTANAGSEALVRRIREAFAAQLILSLGRSERRADVAAYAADVPNLPHAIAQAKHHRAQGVNLN